MVVGVVLRRSHYTREEMNICRHLQKSDIVTQTHVFTLTMEWLIMTAQDTTTTQLKRTSLYEQHKALGARMVDFGGWEMPVQYSGILQEHEAVRTRAGLFDVSHMGEFKIEGADALA